MTKQGYTFCFTNMTHQLGRQGLPDRLGAELQQQRPYPERLLRCVGHDGDWELRRRIDGKISPRRSKARDLWDKIAWAAWIAPIPARNTIRRRSTNGIPARKTGGSTRRIPCSEYMFLDDTACNLASLNLAKFLTRKGSSTWIPSAMPSGCGPWRGDQRADGLVPQPRDRAEELRLPDARDWGMPTSGTILMKQSSV